MPCPFSGVIPALLMAVSNTLRNFDRVRGTKSDFERYAKRGTESDGLLM